MLELAILGLLKEQPMHGYQLSRELGESLGGTSIGGAPVLGGITGDANVAYAQSHSVANIGDIASVLREDPYDMELLISYGTSKGGSAGHLALAIRDRSLANSAS